jgi:small acid-soluble spore protein A (major alpha-type SASP)
MLTLQTIKELDKMANNKNSNTNELLVNGAQQAIDQMKYEIASEFGVNLGPDTTARANGSVGGEITKRLVQMAEQQLGGGRF